MSAISDKYVIELTSGLSSVVISPLNPDIIISGERIEYERNFRKKVNTDIVVDKDGYDYVSNIENSVNRCSSEIFLKVRGINCPLEIRSLVKLNASTFRKSRCQATLKSSVTDNFLCFQNLLKKEYNIFDVPQRTTVQTSEGELELLTSSQTVNFAAYNNLYSQININANPNLTPVDLVGGYRAIHNRQFNINTVAPSMDVTTTWARESVTLPVGIQPIGNGWTLFTFVGGNAIWKRPVQRAYDANQSTNSLTEVVTYYQVVGFADGKLISTKYSNGVRLKDILENMVSSCGISVISDFLNINRDFTFLPNIAYDYSFDFLKDILIYQKSDITLPDANNDATRGIITLERLLKYLKNLYNVEFTLIGNVLRLEHVSYFDATNGLDLTTPQYKDFIVGSDDYSYIENAVPRIERWRFQEESDYVGAFDGHPIEYGENCATGDEKDYLLEQVNNNLSFITNFPNKVSEVGFSLVSFTTNNGVNVISSQDETNDVNGIKLLHENLWRFERPQTDFTMNQNPQTAISTTPIKRGNQISIKLCCGDFDSFNFNQKVKTLGGWATIGDWSYSLKNDLLTLNLLY